MNKTINQALLQIGIFLQLVTGLRLEGNKEIVVKEYSLQKGFQFNFKKRRK